MAEPAQPYPFKYPSLYSPGQIAFNDNPEMSRLISLFAGGMLPEIAGPGNFLPHMMPSQGLIDQYIARQYQNQARMSAFYMAGAGNQDVAKRLLAMRSMVTDAPASELNRAQAVQFAGIINNPITKSIAGSLIGPENLEAMLHGRKGDVAALNQVVNRVGFFRRDPSGGRRMDAHSLEDFSRGVYAHLYDEGGNLGETELGARAAERDRHGAIRSGADYNADQHIRALKKYAKMEDREVVSDAEITDRVTKRIAAKELGAEDVAATYKKYVAGNETDTTKQVEALTKFDAAIKALDTTVKGKSTDKTGLLGKNEVTVDKTVTQARENRLGEMNGFMAGQVGQMAEQMFQRGMLPQAIGAMTPAERVRLMGAESRNSDPATMDRLAREFGHRDLMATDSAYAKLTDAEQRKKLEEQLPGYESKIQAVFKATDDFNKGKRTDVQQIEKMEGFDAVAGNVDAKRSASAIKKYTGAVAAVREIFGDNGNPNAPMPALLAALDHLSQGAAGQMDPKQIETALRSMQQMAKESGVGFEQMAAMAAQMGATGDMLGISKSQTMHNQVNAMAMVKTMRDSGAFSRPVFGAMTQAEATQVVGQKIQEGEASDNARVMAALAGIYKVGPDAFAKDSEFSKAMEAYATPSSGGKYTFNGEEKNIFELVGKHGPQVLQQMFKDAGGTESQLSAAYMNPASQQFAQAGAGFQTQKYEMLRDINNFAVSGTLNQRLKAAKPGTDLAKRDTAATADMTGQAITELILESANMRPEEQVAFIKESMVPRLTEAFKKSGVTDEAEAARLAEQAANAYMGEDATKQNGQIKELIDNAGWMVHAMSGMTMAQVGQMYAKNNPALSAEAARKAHAVAQRKAEIGLNFSSHPLARVSDYLLQMGEKGGKVTFGGLFEALAMVVPEEELRKKYAAGMEGGVEAVQSAINDMTVTEQYIADLDKKNDTTTLKKLAGLDDKTEVVSDKDFEARRTAKMQAALQDDKNVTKEFKRIYGVENTKLSVEQQRARLMSDPRLQAEYDSQTLNKNEISRRQLSARALSKSGNKLRPLPGESAADTAKRAQQLEHLETMRRSFFEGADASSLHAGIHAALNYYGVDADKKNDETGQTIGSELAQLVGNYDPDAEKDKTHKDALAAKIDSLSLSDEQKTEMKAVLEAQRIGAAIDVSGTTGAAMQAQQVAQNIANATIDAGAVTINAARVDGAKPDGTQTSGDAATDAAANAPAASALPPAGGATETGSGTAAGAAGSASAAASATSAEAKNTATASVPPAPSGSGGQQTVSMTGTLELKNLEAGVLTVLAKQAQPIQADGGGASFANHC